MIMTMEQIAKEGIPEIITRIVINWNKGMCTQEERDGEIMEVMTCFYNMMASVKQ